MSREVHVPFYEGLGVRFPRPTHRYCMSFRDVEDLLAERGIIVSYETVRQWCGKFGPDYARQLKRRQGRLGDTWFLDEVFVTINGQRQYLWRAVDQDGDLIDILVQGACAVRCWCCDVKTLRCNRLRPEMAPATCSVA